MSESFDVQSDTIDIPAVQETLVQTFELQAAETVFLNKRLEVILQNVIRHTINANNNITTHYVENGINYEDVTTTDPLTLTVQGWMAEIFYGDLLPHYRKIFGLVLKTSHIPFVGGFIATYLSDIVYIFAFIAERLYNLFEMINRITRSDQSGTSGYDDYLITFDEDKRLGYQLAVLENMRLERLPIDISIPRTGVFHEMMLKNYEWDQDKSYYQAKVTMTFQQVRRTQTILTNAANNTTVVREAEPSILDGESNYFNTGSIVQ